MEPLLWHDDHEYHQLDEHDRMRPWARERAQIARRRCTWAALMFVAMACVATLVSMVSA